jgi:hypothetical protein
MNRVVTRPEDRALFDFLDAGKTPDASPPAASEGFAEAAGPDEKRDRKSD